MKSQSIRKIFLKYSSFSDSLSKVLKLFESFAEPMKPLTVSPRHLSEFIISKLQLINEANETLLQAENIQLKELSIDREDDLERYIALNLLRTNEKLDEIIETGEIRIILSHFENLAKLWLNIFQTNHFKSMKGVRILIQQSLYLFSKLNVLLKIEES